MMIRKVELAEITNVLDLIDEFNRATAAATD